jgi:hypothetical protein
MRTPAKKNTINAIGTTNSPSATSSGAAIAPKKAPIITYSPIAKSMTSSTPKANEKPTPMET